jgi:integrase
MGRKAADLDGFRDWLTGRLRRSNTAEAYARNVRLCFEHPAGALGRLRDDELAPSTRRCQFAALKQYARYAGDDKLLAKLEDIRDMLPRSEPVEDRQPMDEDDWAALRDEIREATYLGPELHGACGMIMFRGFRVGDVCKMTRKNLRKAVGSGTLAFAAKKGRRHNYGIVSTYLWAVELLADCPGKWVQVCDLISQGDPDVVVLSAKERIRRALRKSAKRCGVDPDEVYPHRLRHNYVLAYYRASGNDLEATRQHIGHSDIATTARYIRKMDRERTDAIAEGVFA